MNLTIADADALDSARWNQQLSSLGGPIQLTPEWAAFVSAKDHVLPLFVSGGLDDEPGAAIVYLSGPAHWPLSRWPTAFTDCVPLATDKIEFLAQLERLLRQRGCISLAINSFAYDKVEPLPLAPLGFTEKARLEFVLPLEGGLDAAWRGTRPTLRNDIRRFERSRVSCNTRGDRGIAAVLHGIEEATTARHRTQGKEGLSMREATYDALWATLVNTGRARAYLAERDGVPLASVVIGSCGANAYYLYGGSTPDGLALNAPKGLLWFAIQREYEMGVREFNLGGMNAAAAEPSSFDHGLYKFKTAFGAAQRRCISGNKVFRPTIKTLQDRLRTAFQSVRLLRR